MENKKKSSEPTVNSNLKKLTKKKREPHKVVIRDSDGTLNTIKTCDECKNRNACPKYYNNRDTRMVRCTEFA